MRKKSVLSTLRFVLFTGISIVMIFSAVYLTAINTYKPVVKAYIDGEFVGYFSSEQEFDEIYNDLVTEKQSIDENVKVYLESEPTFEQTYIRDSVLKEQNVYTNLRAEIKTEYTTYKVVADGEEMVFSSEDQANEYVEKLKNEVDDVEASVKVEKTAELKETTSTERADAILADIVDRNKPVVIPEPVVEEPTQNYYTTTYTGEVYAPTSGGVAYPTSNRGVNCEYMGYYGHTGIDLTAPMGSDVYAFMGGTVTFAGWDSWGYGWCVKIDHGNGIVTVYAHNSSLLVSAGQQVSAGQLIAYSGSTGNSTGPHLHFETRVNGVPVDPRIYLNGI